ncbi:MAG TPA: HAD family hydrolase [Candidatus Limnocylindrales bacterium]|nr:HAD family hydrolase [Candidatus Limnocylindrales bacterium]
MALHAALDGIDLVVFDKDGTLIDFQAMWGGWVRSLAENLELETGRPLTGPLFDLLGVDHETGLVRSHGLLAATPMARIREHLVTRLSVLLGNAFDAEAAVDAVWEAPDPIALARPIGDLGALLGALRAAGRRIAVATSDDRDPTTRTLAALGISELVDGIVCADDGEPVKPAPQAVLRLCRELGVEPGRAAVVGDSVADLAMGRAALAGRVIGVLTGVGDRAALEPLADLVLGSVQELATA